MKAKVYVTLKQSVLDPQGSAVQSGLVSMGYTDVKDVRVGKYLELVLDADEKTAEEQIREMCDRLLANPVIEEYRFEITGGES